jgi:hypothetical protein
MQKTTEKETNILSKSLGFQHAEMDFFISGPAQICADLLEIRIDKKNQMSMDVNQKYCQSCHLINRNGFIITKIMSSQICC